MEDHLYNILKYYYESPTWVKVTLGNLYKKIPLKLRYNNIYFNYIDLLKESQWWSIDKLELYQWKKIKDTINHAYQNVPYYRNLFDEWGISLQSIQNFNDLNQIPILTKELVKKNLNLLIAENLPKTMRLYVATGGTTGTPLGLYYQKNISRPKEEAFIHILWKRIGFKLGDKLAVLRGNKVKNAENKNFCEFEPIKNRLILSSHHMIDDNLPIYIEQIKKFKPKFLHVYPSALAILADYFRKNPVKEFPSLKAILASSEMIYPWQVKLFSEIFKCKIFHCYGQIEMCALAGSCESNDEYHIFPEYSYVELIKQNKKFDDPDHPIFEIVGTTFDNYVMPLIRYQTRDYAVTSEDDCKCGRKYKIIKKILGRKQEFFIDKTNSLITFTNADEPLHDVNEKIRAYQYVQFEPGIVHLNIEVNNKFKQFDLSKVEKNLKKIYSRFNFVINIVKSIPKTENGKFRYLVQKTQIDIEDFQKYEST